MIQGRTLLRSVTLGLGLALAAGALAPAAPPPPQAPQPESKSVYYNQRKFWAPVTIPPADVARLRLVQLWSSTNGGATWKLSATTPADTDRPSFEFSAPTDGEYWLAARTVDKQGRRFPADDADIVPNMKVMIDTKKPRLTIEPRARKGNIASIAWDAADEALAPETLAFAYQAGDSADWVPIPLPKPSRFGVESWDAGTAEPIRVRGTVADKAKNRQTVVIELPGGGPSEELLAMPSSLDESAPPPVGTFASEEGTRPASTPTPAPAPPRSNRRPARAEEGETAGAHDPFADDPDAGEATGGAPVAPIVVASPKFALQYAVDDAGPNGPSVVELYVTRDNGQTWASRGTDPDKTSPFQVDLGGDGRFGLKLVARSAAEQGDRPPVPGEPPRTVVEVDTAGPAVTFTEQPRLVGNRLVIRWQARDDHPGARPVMISIRPDTPDGRWQIITPTPIDNNGQYSWVVSPRCPPKIHVRVDVRDALNNLGFAETTETGSVLVDRSKPKGRILGLDAQAVNPIR